MDIPESIPAPQALLKNLSHLSTHWQESHQPVLLFTLESLSSGLRSEIQIDRAVRQHLDWICEDGRYQVAILADLPVHQLRSLRRHPELLLLGSGGYEIESRKFRWRYPGIATMLALMADWKMELVQGYGNAVGESIRDHGSWLEVGLVSLEPALRKRIRIQLLGRVDENPKVEIRQTDTHIVLRPREMWDRGQALQNLLNLLPRREGRPPELTYIGSQVSDKAAFRYLYRSGIPIYYGDAVPPISIKVRYYIKGRAELNRFLYWLHSH